MSDLPNMEERVARQLNALAEERDAEQKERAALASGALLRPAIAEAMRSDAYDTAVIMIDEGCLPAVALKKKVSDRHQQETRHGLFGRRVEKTWVNAEYAETRLVWLLGRTFTISSNCDTTSKEGGMGLYGSPDYKRQGVAMDYDGELIAFHVDRTISNITSDENPLKFLIDDATASDLQLAPDSVIAPDVDRINEQPLLISWREQLARVAANAISGQRYVPPDYNVTGIGGPPYFWIH